MVFLFIYIYMYIFQISTDAKKITNNNGDKIASDSDNESQKTNKIYGGKIQNINYQSTKHGKRNANRYALKFFAETDEEIAAIKKDARKPLVTVTPELLEYGSELFRGYDFPIRPTWSYAMNKERLERSEKSYFEVIIIIVVVCVLKLNIDIASIIANNKIVTI